VLQSADTAILRRRLDRLAALDNEPDRLLRLPQSRLPRIDLEGAKTEVRLDVTPRRLVFRPWPSLDPYRVGQGLYLCSPSTPPGGGVHGMSGMLAARSALTALTRELR
jgi:hypothetical protein